MEHVITVIEEVIHADAELGSLRGTEGEFGVDDCVRARATVGVGFVSVLVSVLYSRPE